MVMNYVNQKLLGLETAFHTQPWV